MPPKRNILVSLSTQVIVSLVVVVFAISIFVGLRVTRPEPEASDDPMRTRRVEVMEAVTVPVRRQWQGFGTAKAKFDAEVPAEVMAVVIEVSPRLVVGNTVEKGEVLAGLDDTDFVLQESVSVQRIEDFDAQLKQLEFEEKSWKERVDLAKQDVALAEADFDRVQAAFQAQAARQREVDQARQRVVAAVRIEVAAREQYEQIIPRRTGLVARKAVEESMLRLARKNVERCTIRSPLSGVIAAEDLDVGESLSPGQLVVYIVNLEHIEVPLRLAASARPSVAVGDEVLLASQGATRQRWRGTVGRISPADDPETRTMSVFVDLVQDPDDPGRLAPGKFVQGTVTSSRPELRTVVPRRSLLSDRLMLVQDNVVRSMAVGVDFHIDGDFPELGVEAEQWAVLSDPIPDGALVVVNGTSVLPDGLHVYPIGGGQGVTSIPPGDREVPQ